MEGTIGEVRIVAYNWAPRMWGICNGAILSIASNTALFSIIGTMYGGNGSSTFALPDLRGRVPIQQGHGAGLPNYTIGQMFGEENVTLISTEMAAHTHPVTVNSLSGSVQVNTFNDSSGNVNTPVNNHPALAPNNIYNNTTDGANMAPSNVVVGGSMNMSIAGGSQSHNNMQPFLVMNYVICMQGIYPARN